MENKDKMKDAISKNLLASKTELSTKRYINQRYEMLGNLEQFGFVPQNVSISGDFVYINKTDSKTGKAEKYKFSQLEILSYIMGYIETQIDAIKLTKESYLIYFKPDDIDAAQIKHSPGHDEIYKKIKKAHDKSQSRSKEDFYKYAEKMGLDDDEKNLRKWLNQDNINIEKMYFNILKRDFCLVMFQMESVRNIYLDKITADYREIIKQEFEIMTEQLKELVYEYIQEDYKSVELYEYFAPLVRKDSGMQEYVRFYYNATGIPDNMVINAMENFFTADQIKEFVKMQPESVITRRNLTSYLIKKKYTTVEEIRGIINQDFAEDIYIDTKNQDILKYLKTQNLIKLYQNKVLDINLLIKYTKLKDILISDLSKNEKIKILKSGNGKRAYNNAESSLIWELYEREYFSTDEIFELEQLGYIHVNTIIKDYIEQKNRKIAIELGAIPMCSSEKIYNFFTPEFVYQNISAGINDEVKKFYFQYLKEIYEENSDNLELDVAKMILGKYNGDDNKAAGELFLLYNQGFISLTTLKDIKISEEMFKENCAERGSLNEDLICLYNAGVILQEDIFELIEDRISKNPTENEADVDMLEKELLTLISEGMNASVIDGMYTTRKYINMAKYGILSLDNLSQLKNSIKTGLEQEKSKEITLTDMYLSKEISYEELNSFVKHDVISKDEFMQINEKFDLQDGIDKLKKNGGISGKSIYEIEFENLSNHDCNAGECNSDTSEGKHRFKDSQRPMGIDRKLIMRFYKELGADEFLLVNAESCPIFEDYVLIPVVEKKICYLEGGNGTRTYIVPLKIILEQVENPGSSLDIVGNSSSRTDFNKKIEGNGDKANHTKNWAKNILIKTEKISPRMTREEKLKFEQRNEILMNKIAESYESRRKNQGITLA